LINVTSRLSEVLYLGVFEVDDIALRTGKPRKRQSQLARSAVRF
jgi:hypothetical protein